MKNSLLSLALAATVGLAYVASSSAQEAPPSGGKNPAVDAALQACASVAKDASGRPDRTALDACMSAKGFTKPTAPPKSN